MNNTKVEISNILKRLGVSPDLYGYTYLKEAVEMVMSDETILHKNVTKTLYPTIARRCNSTATRVERAIRHAVEISAKKSCFEDLYKEIFGSVISDKSGKATNSQFIGCVADYLVLSREMTEQ